MSSLRTLRKLGVTAIVVVCAGCGQKDKQCLSRIGQKIAQRMETATTHLTKTVGYDLQKRMLPASPRRRVANRLLWDKQLEDETINVGFENGVIRLEGTVTNLAARRRAVDLAQSTVGVEKVVDELTVASAE